MLLIPSQNILADTMTFSQADADKLNYLRYASRFPGTHGLRAARDLAAFISAWRPEDIESMERHIEVCTALLAGSDHFAR